MPVIRMTRPPGYKRASIFLDLHGQRTETVDETGVDALGLARDLHAHPPRRHFLEQNAQLQLGRSEEHTSELPSLMRISYAVFCLQKYNITEQILPNVSNSNT